MMKSARLLCLVAFAVVFLSSLSAQGATAISHPPPRLTTTFTIVENQTENATVGQLVQYGGADFRFSVLSSNSCSQFFMINRNTSIIRTVGMLDREAIVRAIGTDQLQCFVQYHNTTIGINANVQITIIILDVNDEVPHFHNLVQPQIVEVIENLAAPTPLLRLEPVDDDSGMNGTVHFNITSGDTEYFRIMRPLGDTSDSALRLLFLQRTLDFERYRSFNLTIRMSDMGSPLNNFFDQQIVILVGNSHDEPPTFTMSSFQFQVAEDHPVGISHPFANITAANSHDVLGSIFYYLCDESGRNRTVPAGAIRVNEVTGGLYLNQSLDIDNLSAPEDYSFCVEANNPSGFSQNAFAHVTVEDVNDNAPYFTCTNRSSLLLCPPESTDNPHFTWMQFSTGENSLTDRTRLRLDVHDDDRTPANQQVEYDLIVEPHIEVLFVNLGRFVIVGIAQELDREVTPNVTMSITIRNTASPQLSSTAVISILVEDLNDNAPTFTQTIYNTYISEGAPVGKQVTTVEAFDSDVDENGKVSYTITAVDKEAARDWFQISTSTGTISVAAVDEIDYHAVQGVVVLTVMATDNGVEPLSSTALVRVEIVAAITYSARSYQAFANYNLATSQDFHSVYLEFQTSLSEGVLLHHPGENGAFSLDLEEQRVVLRQGGEIHATNTISVADSKWHSVYVERNDQGFRLDVWRTESRGAHSALLSALTQNCSENEAVSREQLLFIGGINPLSLISEDATRSDFVGAIRNVIIGQSQVNLRCPREEENTLIGVQRSSLCRNEELRCSPTHSMGCVDYAEESFCRCRGGFASLTCSLSTAGQVQDDYAPIRLHGNGHVSLDLPYSFFYDLKVLKQSSGNDGGPSAPGGKRRQVNDPETSTPTLQKVEITFRLVEVGASVLLHSESQNFIHQLMILNQYAIAYQVFDKSDSISEPRDQVLISNLDFQNGTEYHVSITYSNIDTTMAITTNMRSRYNNDAWDTNQITLFAEQPETSLSIGGSPRGNNLFIGCISSLKIDEIDIPLSGLAFLSAEEGGFVYNSSGLVVEPYCDLCDLTTCSSNMTCVSDNYGETGCECPVGHVLDEMGESCSPIVIPTGGPLATETLSGQPIHYMYIAGGVAGGVLLIAVLIVIVIVAVRLQHAKKDKRKRTYSVTSMTSNGIGILPPQRTSKSGNDYVRVEPKRCANDDDSLSTLGTIYRPESQERGSSVSTFQEHADDADPEIEEPRFQRCKSTVSAESGIRTDTERDSSIRGTSRMDDSGTDYTPQESESDDMTSSIFMEQVSSPNGIHLLDSASSVMGVPIKVTSPCVPLTPQERKVITPLRPDNIHLSVGKIDHTHRDTDFETDISSCNLQSLHQNCSLTRGSDSDISTRESTPKWYKSSTASDNERESERAHRNAAAYYPTPVDYPPRPKTAFSGAAPDYVPPPSISTRKSASPAYPHSPTRRFPPTMISADSTLTRNNHKYENYPLPYSSTLPRPSDKVRDRQGTATRGAMASYENHRLQHQISAPHEHLGGAQGRHVYFAKSSHTLHYSHSVGNGSYATTAAEQQQTSRPDSRRYYNVTLTTTIPTTLQYRPNRSYSSSDAPPADREPTQFQDLKNVSTINPITYWETQDRLKPAVDQVDPYQVLSEPYIQFEDVSTDLSVTDSQATLHAEGGADHEVFESQGGGEGTADLGPGCLTRLDDHDIVSIASNSQSIPGGITHFPSADCSNEYTATINGTSSSSDSTPKYKPSNGMDFSSQQSFDV